MRFFNQTRWFEAYFEVKAERVLDHFYDHLSEDGNHEFWLGRCYLTVHFYRRKATAIGTEGEAA